MTTRILLIGFDKIELHYDEMIEKCDYLSDSPTLFDYDIIVAWDEAMATEKKREEFTSFFKGKNGVIVIFSANGLKQGILPTKLPSFENKKGTEYYLNNNHPFSNVYREFITKEDEFEWSWYLKDDYDSDLVIAWNGIRHAVAYEYRVDGGGKILVLSPGGLSLRKLVWVKRKNALGKTEPKATIGTTSLGISILRSVIDIVKSGYSGVSVAPAWIGHYTLPNESALRSEHDKIGRQLQGMDERKKILYATETELSRIVGDVLRELGFKSTWTELTGKYDVEIELDENRIGVVDVRGLEKGISIHDIDQLHRHCADQEMEELEGKNRDVKGIFIVNHYRSKDPKERPRAFTEKAVEFAKKHGYCLMTTVQLFHLIEKHNTAIKESILEAAGEFKLG